MRLLTLVAVLVFIPVLSPAEEVSGFTEMLQRDWLRQAELRYSTTAEVSPEDDAAGGVDGVIDGKWGFHTDSEPNPYWQVDIGEITDIGRVVLYNRCDASGERNKYIILSVSDNAENWTKVWQNNGTMFYGATDSKPMVVNLTGKSVRGRYVRLSLEGTHFLHLDQVQVYKPGSDENIALYKNATQSSTSPWSTKHAKHAVPDTDGEQTVPDFVFQKVLESGRQLAEDLRTKGIDVSQAVAVFDAVEKGTQDVAEYFKLRQTIRSLALSNPLFDFDEILFAKQAPAAFPHPSDMYYCFWQRGGGCIGILENFKSERPSFRNLTAGWKNGTFFRPELSYCGTKVLFAYSEYDPGLAELRDKTDKSKIAEDTWFSLYEMEIATGKTLRLTQGKYDDFDGRYLPDGDVVFLSTRKGRELQATVFGAEEMRFADLPDSYVRCGGDYFRPVPVFSLHKIEPGGNRITQISAFENFEWTPALMNDGRLVYTRWDYIDRFNGDWFSLWAKNPDGTNTSLIYGNYTRRPQVPLEAMAIPGTNKLIFVASAHHSSFGGSLVLLNPSLGQEGEEPITRLTPEVVFPETEGWSDHYYLNPYPLSEDYYLVAWSDKRLPPCHVTTERENPSNSIGIYYFDRFGNLELLYRDERISSMNPIPLKSRLLPPIIPSYIEWGGVQEGEFMVQNVYEGLKEYGITPDKHRVKSLRIVSVIPKVQPHQNSPVLGVSAEEPGKFVLGTVPVEDDGSVYFRVPSSMPYFFQVLDEDGVMLQTMRSVVYLMPSERQACIGCHENRTMTVGGVTSTIPKAMTRKPSALRYEPSGTWPLRFDELVQPVLDRHCISCHSPNASGPDAANLDLTPQKAWSSLISFHNNDLKNLAFERDQSIPGENIAAKSRLMHILLHPAEIPAHAKLTLPKEDLYRFVVWMDTYAHIVGAFSPQQEKELELLRKKYEHLFEPWQP